MVFKNRLDNESPITGDMRVKFYTLFPEDGYDWITTEYSGSSYSLTVYPSDGEYFIPGEYYYAAICPGSVSLVISMYTDDQVATLAPIDFCWQWIERSKIAVLREIDKGLSFENIDINSYASLGESILPDGIDKKAIQEVIFHTSSNVTTGTIVPSSIPKDVRWGYVDVEYYPVYFELKGTTAHYYTKADRYMMEGPRCISFIDWHELRSVDLSMFCTSQVAEFDSMFWNCINLESVNLSSFDTHNSRTFAAMFDSCKKLRKLDISNFSSVNAQAGGMFRKCHNLVSLDLGDFNISGAYWTMDEFARNSRNCAIRCNAGTREALCEPNTLIKEEYITWVQPDDEMPILDPYRFDYHSTDFSKDKTIKVLQEASVGKGINIVLIGEGYSDRMIADGSYDDDMRKAMNAIFKDEPYASFRNYFNVYEVYAVSENELPGESNTVFDVVLGGIDSENGPYSYYEEYNIKKYARIPDDDINETCVILIVNQTPGILAGVAHPGYIIEGDDVNDVTDYARGGSVALVCRQMGDDYYSFVVAHEFGHGFAKLADEYIVYGGAMEDWEKESYINMSNQYGWWKNIDFTNNPASIKWSRFLSDERYAGTVDIYEGATYSNGCWRPSEYSIMHNDAVESMFNAPSREAIYKRIHRLAFGKEWQYDYEEFVEYDQKNIDAEKAALAAPMILRPSACEILGKPFMKIDKSVTPDGEERIRVIMN